MSRYRPQNYIGWALTVIGTGLLSLLDADSSTAMLFGFQVLVGAGLGIVWISTQFPILAPLPYSNNAHALAFFTFTRCFAQVLYPIPLELPGPLFSLILINNSSNIIHRHGEPSSAAQFCKTHFSPDFLPLSPPLSHREHNSHTPSSHSYRRLPSLSKRKSESHSQRVLN